MDASQQTGNDWLIRIHVDGLFCNIEGLATWLAWPPPCSGRWCARPTRIAILEERLDHRTVIAVAFSGHRDPGAKPVQCSSSLLKNSDQNTICATIIGSGLILNLSCVLGSVFESMLLTAPSKNLFQQTARLNPCLARASFQDLRRKNSIDRGQIVSA